MRRTARSQHIADFAGLQSSERVPLELRRTLMGTRHARSPAMAMTRGRERCFTLLTVRSRQPKQPRELGGGPSRRDMLASQTGNMRKWGKAVVAMLVAVGAAFTACGGAIVSSDAIEMTSLDASSSATPSLDAAGSATPIGSGG